MKELQKSRYLISFCRCFRLVCAVLCLAVGLFSASVQAGTYEDGRRAFEAEEWAEAFRLWLVLADRGHAPSQLALAELYLNGLGTAEDPVVAWLYATLARQGGLGDTLSLLDEIEGRLDDKDLALARRLVSDWQPVRPVDDVQQREDPRVERWFTAAEKGQFKTVQNMVAEGFPVDRRDRDDWTAVQFAALAGRPKTVAVLIAAGADVNQSDPLGMTPLMAAAVSGSRRTVTQLIAAGADPDAQDSAGETATYMAEQAGHLRLARDLERMELPRDKVKRVQTLLIQAGYLSGVADGVAGKKTRAAIRTFQKENGLKENGLVRPVVLRTLEHQKKPQ